MPLITQGRDATPYLERNRVGRDAIDAASALTDMGKYLFLERRLPVYDIAVAITKLDMCRSALHTSLYLSVCLSVSMTLYTEQPYTTHSISLYFLLSVALTLWYLSLRLSYCRSRLSRWLWLTAPVCTVSVCISVCMQSKELKFSWTFNNMYLTAQTNSSYILK